MKRLVRRAYGINDKGERVLIDSDMTDTARRAGQALEAYTQDLVARNESFFRMIIVEDMFA